MTRAQTLTLALLTLHLVMGLMCLAVARSERPSAALRLWGWALLAFSAGAFITLLTFLPLAARQVTGNTVISLSAVFSTAALLEHTGFRVPRTWAVAGVAACCAGLIVSHALGLGLVVDIAIPTLFATLGFVLAIVQLWRSGPSPERPAVVFLCAALAVTVLVWNARLVAIGRALGGTWERDRADLIVSLFAIAQLVVLVADTLGLIWIEVCKLSAYLERMALTDMLTNLPNRRAMRMRFEEELARARRAQTPFAIVLFDLDHFKRINDGHGHLAGDAVLAWVANTLGTSKRGADALGRIGGEEFLLLLPELDRESAIAAVERLRDAVGAVTLEHGGAALHATLSGGLAVFPEDGEDWDRLFSAADRRLYKAKHAGRDQLVADDLASAAAN